MRIKILKDGRYNNADRSAVDCEAGSEFETSAAYAEILIADGLAEYVEEPDPVDGPEAKKATKKTGKKDKSAPAASAPDNPFVP